MRFPLPPKNCLKMWRKKSAGCMRPCIPMVKPRPHRIYRLERGVHLSRLFREVVFLDEALDKESKRVKERFPCPHCGAEVSKRRLEKNYTTEFDNISSETRQVPKRTPSIICYKIGKNRIEKKPDQADLDILRKNRSNGTARRIT